jgi:hypothetical protein
MSRLTSCWKRPFHKSIESRKAIPSALATVELLPQTSALRNYSRPCRSGGYAKQITATAGDAVYAIDSDNSVWSYSGGTGVLHLGGYALAISAGPDANGNPEVYAIGPDNSRYVNDGSGFVNLGGYVKQISATVQDTVYAIGMDDAVYANTNGGGFVGLGGYAKEISAGLDANGNPEVFAISQTPP